MSRFLPKNTAASAVSAPVLYFDGGCTVCQREVALYRRQDGAAQICWVDVSQCAPDQLGEGLSREAAMRRLHLRRADGQVVSGAAAFTALWQLLPRFAWLGRLLGRQPLLTVLEAGYRVFLLLRRLWRQAR